MPDWPGQIGQGNVTSNRPLSTPPTPPAAWRINRLPSLASFRCRPKNASLAPPAWPVHTSRSC